MFSLSVLPHLYRAGYRVVSACFLFPHNPLHRSMKKAFLLLFALISGSTVYAQTCLLADLKKGSLVEMTSYDAKQKVTGRTVQTVTDMTTAGGVTTATFHQQ